MSRIDQKTSIPLSVVCAVLVFVGSGVWATAFWVSHVDDAMRNFNGRVARIEHFLGIEEPEESQALNRNPFENEAQAQVFRMKHKESGYGVQKGN